MRARHYVPPQFAGGIPASCERVAQPVEQLTFNQWVVGSSPTALTTANHLRLLVNLNSAEENKGGTSGAVRLPCDK
jgi:hypothetical protein